MQKAPGHLVLQEVVKKGLFELILLPVWWYTTGLKDVFFATLNSMRSASVFFGLGVWVKNLFVPMYGETSFSGRAISFGVRLVVIAVRGLAVLLTSGLAWIGLALYLIILPAALFYSAILLLELLI